MGDGISLVHAVRDGICVKRLRLQPSAWNMGWRQRRQGEQSGWTRRTPVVSEASGAGRFVEPSFQSADSALIGDPADGGVTGETGLGADVGLCADCGVTGLGEETGVAGDGAEADVSADAGEGGVCAVIAEGAV